MNSAIVFHPAQRNTSSHAAQEARAATARPVERPASPDGHALDIEPGLVHAAASDDAPRIRNCATSIVECDSGAFMGAYCVGSFLGGLGTMATLAATQGTSSSFILGVGVMAGGLGLPILSYAASVGYLAYARCTGR